MLLTIATEHLTALFHSRRYSFPIDIRSIKSTGNARPQDEDSRSSAALEAESARSSDSGSVHSNSLFSWSAGPPCEDEGCQEWLRCHVAPSTIASNLIPKTWYSRLPATSLSTRFRETSSPEGALRLSEFVADNCDQCGGGLISPPAEGLTAKLLDGERAALVEKPSIID